MKSIFTQHKKLSGDTITPISCFLNLRDVYASAALFESSDYSSKSNSKSFICLAPISTFSTTEEESVIREGNAVTRKAIDNLSEAIEAYQKTFDFKNQEVIDQNGFFGLVSYDAIPQFESVKFQQRTHFNDLPIVCFSIYRYVLVFDNFTNQIDVLINTFENEEVDVEDFILKLNQQKNHQSNFYKKGNCDSNETDQSYARKVLTAKDYVKKGDVFQVVISRAFQQGFKGDEFEVYRKLRGLNPSPYMFYFELDKGKLFGASPEAQIRIDKGLAEIHPIAGTAKRSGDLKIDNERIIALKNDLKENAEHTMLVDLARNDLNITCNDVQVESYKDIQSFSHVIHMVSKVTGKLLNDQSVAAFSKSFPAGTLSGAPKYRAMEIISEIEDNNRGYYGGAIGHISPKGDVNMAIIIRSCLSYEGQLHYQAGAGIVMDSVPENEVQEVYNKIGAVQKAIDLASQSNPI
ncbi:MAG: anthranilate synthase component 1 [Crocinitomix sp.]|jgi:anthranilate synthase component 1